MRKRWLIGASLVVLTACSGTDPGSGSPAPAPATSAPSSPASNSPAPPTSTAAAPRRSPTAPVLTPAQRVLARLSLVQRVGQLFMVGTEAGADAGTTSVIASNHVGAVILMRSSSQGVAGIASVTTALQAAANGDSIRLFVATDQEGGEVQRMTGPGFSTIPSAIEQGSLDPATLQRSAARWGAQLRAAGVNVDLAPVLDTVPSAAFAPANPPIGALDREFGFDPQIVAAHGSAFAQGLAAAGVSATVKHFPGLGRVTGNTDTTAGVTDTETTRNDPYLTPFTRAIRAGAPFVMMSTAVYSRIDPAGPAAFSSIIVTGLLRNTLGFRGVVISDDVGAAAQVAAVPVAERALRFIAAGGDIVLTVDATQIAEMTAAVIARAQRDPAFRARVDAAALRVLTAKQAHGLL